VPQQLPGPAYKVVTSNAPAENPGLMSTTVFQYLRQHTQPTDRVEVPAVALVVAVVVECNIYVLMQMQQIAVGGALHLAAWCCNHLWYTRDYIVTTALQPDKHFALTS
jgi:hypothetical protein